MGLYADLREMFSAYANAINDRYTKEEVDIFLSQQQTDLNQIYEDLQQVDSLSNDMTLLCSELRVDEDGLVSLLNIDGSVIAGPYGPFAGGSGGGSASGNNARIELHNAGEWLMKTIADGDSCYISFTWSSVEDELPTGNGVLSIIVNGATKAVIDVAQGNNEIEVSEYLSSGNNNVRVKVSDTYGNSKTINYTVKVVSVSIRSTFNPTLSYQGVIPFPYTPIGSVEKTVYFKVDDNTPETKVTSVSGSQLTYNIPEQTHGNHKFECWFTCVVNGMTVESNHLKYDIICTVDGNNDPIIAVDFSETSVMQYTTVQIPYSVYTPGSNTSEVTFKRNGTTISTLTVDRTQQMYEIKMNYVGSNTIVIQSGKATRTIILTVNAVNIDVEAETENLELYLSSSGRSNSEENPGRWSYGNISATFSGFDFASDGWQRDEDGNTVLRVSEGAYVTIPVNLFKENTRATGMTFEIEFTAKNVANFDTVILQSWHVNRGLLVTPNEALVQSEQTKLSIPFNENEHITLAITVGKRTEGRLVRTYVDGIVANITQYPDDDDWAQIVQKPLKIGGQAGCTIDIYKIRVYSNDLLPKQVVDNWIVDTQDGSLMLDRYARNNVFDDHLDVVYEKLPRTLPYMIIDCEELPQYKGDKKTVSVTYVDPLYSSRSFTATGCQANVQGTTSAPYAVKNLDLQFKNGFDMQSGSHEDKYILRPGDMPTNRFVIKADVASSESANNTQLVRLYNDICPYKFPEMLEDSRVRWGIDGIQIVMFWRDGSGILHFKGKYNFNFPKRFPAGYGYSGNDESWEFQNNTSNRMLFKDNDFSRIYTDPETLEERPEWRNDFEARFPEDTWEDITKLKEFMDWIVTTDRSEATGDSLDSSETYDGTTYSIDSQAYRLAKFKDGISKYAQLDSLIFYYIFTEFFLMVDSRAKNLFIGFHGDDCTIQDSSINRKLVPEPYDMDTAMGTNNEGTLSYGYSFEDTDHLNGADIFNGQNSVLWCNLRDGFRANIVQMYQTLRSTGGLNMTNVESRFENAQKLWPENIWNEDAKIKYTDPLLNPEPGKESTAFYLPMAQGSKKSQRKWWLTKRFAYMDSKWNAGDALKNVIQLRGYAKSNVAVTPYIDMYPTVKFGSYLVQSRGSAGVASTMVCPMDNVNDTEIYIYSAPYIADAGDLSGLKVGVADFSAATNIKRVKVGSDAVGYSNPNMRSLSFGSNVLLEVVDARNCTNLGTGDQKSIDMSNCSILKELYFEGTAIQGLTLPNGAPITTIHVPATITNITLRNLTKLEDLTVAGYSNISTLWIENCGSIDMLTMLSNVPANTRIHLIGVIFELSDDASLTALKNKLDTMRGIDEFGNNQEAAYVQGLAHGTTLSGSAIGAFNNVYPFIRVTADTVNSVLTYKDTDGTTTLKTVNCANGVPQEGGPSTNPTKTADAQYTYTFVGWSRTQNSTDIDSDATTDVYADRTLYPVFSKTINTYTVTWMNGGTVLEIDTDVPYGENPIYNGTMPVSNGATATGWTPSIGPVTGNITYSASFKTYIITWVDSDGTTLRTDSVGENIIPSYGDTNPTDPDGNLPFNRWLPEITRATSNATYTAYYIDDTEITDSWSTILSKIANGTANYRLGQYKPINLGSEGIINMQIVGDGVNTSELVSGGNATYDFIAKEVLATQHEFNESLSYGWPESSLRTWLNSTIYDLFPSDIKSAIKEVVKYSKLPYHNYNNSESPDRVSNDKIWIPSSREICITAHNRYTEDIGPVYNKIYPKDETRIKYDSEHDAVKYTLRSCDYDIFLSSNVQRYIDTNGMLRYVQVANTLRSIAIGFSL